MKKIGEYLEITSLSAETFPAESSSADRYVIRGKLNAVTPVKVLYMASLELDSIEMIESFRLSVEPGENAVELPEIAVINPIRSNDEKSGIYTLTLKIYASGGTVHQFSSEVRF